MPLLQSIEMSLRISNCETQTMRIPFVSQISEDASRWRWSLAALPDHPLSRGP